VSDNTKLGGLYIVQLSDIHYYGGRATQFAGRWARHRRALEKGVHSNSYMQAVFNQYSRFEPQILHVLDTLDDMIAAETEWLSDHYGKDGCVNLNPFAHGGNGPHTEATKAKPRGPRHTEEQKRKWSRERRGVKPSPEAIAKSAATRTGMTMSVEARRNMSRAQKGRVITDSHRANLRAAWARRKAAGIETRSGPRKYTFDLQEVIDYLNGGGSLRGACRRFMGGEGDRKAMRKWLVAAGAWPR